MRYLSLLKITIQNILARFGYKIIRIRRGPNPIHLWDEDRYFNSLMREIEKYTIVDKVRCFMIYQFAKQVSESKGDVAEFGVYRGGTAKLLAKVFEAQNKMVHLFDTFSGMPPTQLGKDLHKEGEFDDTSLDNVKAFLHDCRNVRFYKGFFPGIAKPLECINFCLVHIDVDIYKSVMDGCEFFYPRMVEGGIMIFDDYGFLSCPGAKKAVDEFFQDRPENPGYLPTGQCIVIKS